MNSLFIVILSVLSLYGLLILGLYSAKRLTKWVKKQKNRSSAKRALDEDRDIVMKLKEMKEIEKENFRALGQIKVFLSDQHLDNKLLRETVIPEFNRNAPAPEHFLLNLSDKKLRLAIQEKAEEYYATSNPLLEILAESFVARKSQ